MGKVTSVKNLFEIRSNAIMGIIDLIDKAEGDYCVKVVKAIGKAIVARNKALVVSVQSDKYFDPVTLKVRGEHVGMDFELSYQDKKDWGRKSVARFVTIHDNVQSCNTLWNHPLSETRDDLARHLPIKIFEIACPEVCETIKKIVGVDITSDLREAVRQPMRRKGADGASLAGGPTG